MFVRNSRYIATKTFEPDSNGNTVFSGVRARHFGSATGVIEHVVRAGDRLDLLALHYYNNNRMWWRIVDANPQSVFAGNLIGPEMEGEVILIPKERE